jgi:hypothetical protein
VINDAIFDVLLFGVSDFFNLCLYECFHEENNQITFIPSEIGHLSNVKSIYFSEFSFVNVFQIVAMIKTHLMDLLRSGPFCILHLLAKKHEDKNQIASVPSEIGQLSNLKEIYFCEFSFVAMVPDRI